MIEAAYTQDLLPVWTEDEAGPYQTLPYPGAHWRPTGDPVPYPHEYVRTGTAKRLTLFHPASGAVRVKGTRNCPNAVLHPWLTAELATVLAALPEPTAALSPQDNRRCWERWQQGLSVRITLPADVPPLRLLLVLDNLAGHVTPSLVLWLFAHGVMPRSTPLGGVEHGGIDPAHSQAAGVGRPASVDTGGDHRLAGGGRARLEPAADALCVGWHA